MWQTNLTAAAVDGRLAGNTQSQIRSAGSAGKWLYSLRCRWQQLSIARTTFAIALVVSCASAWSATATSGVVRRVENLGTTPILGNPWISDYATQVSHSISSAPALWFTVGDKFEFKFTSPSRKTWLSTSIAQDRGDGVGCFMTADVPLCNSGDMRGTLALESPEIGAWSVELRFNGALLKTTNYSVLPYTIIATSGGSQTLQPGSSSDAMNVAIRSPDGGLPTKVGGYGSWTISTQPRNGDATVDWLSTPTPAAQIARFYAGLQTGSYVVQMTHSYAPGRKLSFPFTVAGVDPLDLANDEKMLGDVDLGGCNAPTRASTKNPVKLANGNKFKVDEDYISIGKNPVRFTRYYNALDTRTTALGLQWRHFYSRSIAVTTVKAKTVTTATAKVSRADGAVYTYKSVNSGPWIGDPDVLATLQSTPTGFVYTCEGDNQEHYDSTGRLSKLTLRGGTFPQTMSYDASGRLSRVSDSGGRAIQLAYDALGMLQSVADPSGRAISYGYRSVTGGQSLSSIVGQDGQIRRSLFGPYWKTQGVLAPNSFGERPDDFVEGFLEWDNLGRIIGVRSGDEYIDILYKDNGSRQVVDKISGQKEVFSFSLIQGVARRTASTKVDCQGCPGATSSTVYPASGNVSEWTDYLGSKTTVLRNSRQLEESRIEGVGTSLQRTVSTTWHPTYRLPTSIGKPGQRTDFAYDSLGNMTRKSVSDLIGGKVRSWTYGYDANSRLIRVDGPRDDVSDVTLISYDAAGNVATLTNPMGHVTAYTAYDAHGRVLRSVDSNGLVTSYTYDPRGRVLSVVRGDRTWMYSYDFGGRLVRSVAPDGTWREYEYERSVFCCILNQGKITLGRLIGIRSSAGETTNFTLDEAGRPRVVTTVGAGGSQVRSYVRDREGRVLSEYDGNGVLLGSYRYDALGNTVAVIAPSGRTTSTAYDIFGRKVSAVEPDGGATAFSYDERDNVVGVIDPIGAVWSFAFDGHDNMTSELGAASGRSTYSYDVAGNLTGRTWANGRSISRAYDALNRVVSEADGSGGQIGYRYDVLPNGVGRLAQMLDLSGNTNFSYSPHGEVLSKVRTTGMRAFGFSYGYDSAGRLTSMRYPSSLLVGYSYDAGGRVGSVTANGASLLQSLSWHPSGSPSSWVQGNGRAVSRSFDAAGRLASHIFEGGSRSIGYDTDGRITSVSAGGRSTSYGYDNAARLVSETDGAHSLAYTYDVNGNRRTRSATGWGAIDGSTTYGYSGNVLQGLSGAQTGVLGYDQAGNLTADGSASFAYDARNQLSQSPGVSFGYDGQGLRSYKQASTGEIRYFAFGLGLEALGEYLADGSAAYETIYIDSMPVAVARAGNLYWIDADQLGAPGSVQNTQGQIVWKWESEAFGSTPAQQNPSGLGVFEFNQRFPGQMYDRESGLHYNVFRYYAPSIGRYTQSDPIGLAGGINTYAYVGGNPLSHVDPEGLQSLTAEGLVRGAVGGGLRGFGGGLLGIGVGVGIGVLAESCRPTEQDREERACDRQYEADLRYCASLASLRGVSRGRRAYNDVYSRCVAAAEKKYVQCYQDAAKP
jgi:RHS repeat-associated protein